MNPRARWFTPVLEGLLIAGIYFVLLLIVSFALLASAVMLRVPLRSPDRSAAYLRERF